MVGSPVISSRNTVVANEYYCVLRITRNLFQVVVKMGVKRTDPGWLGSGIYFGEADTAAGYAGQSHVTNTAFMLGVKVALGNMKDYNKITYGLAQPPKGFQSCHGQKGTQFYDDE